MYSWNTQSTTHEAHALPKVRTFCLLVNFSQCYGFLLAGQVHTQDSTVIEGLNMFRIIPLRDIFHFTANLYFENICYLFERQSDRTGGKGGRKLANRASSHEFPHRLSHRHLLLLSRCINKKLYGKWSSQGLNKHANNTSSRLTFCRAMRP